jgi:hydroxyacylglutathione hydrolase
LYFEQIVHTDLGCASYIVGASDTHNCAVVDPRWEVEPYLTSCAKHGLRVTAIVETHTHADHVSGHGRLAAATGAPIYVHEQARVEFDHTAVTDGDTIALGNVVLHVIHTPGHRPEHIALAIEDWTRGQEPWMVLSGDSLFVGDVARPDLAVDGREGASLLFTSLHDKILALPDFAAVYPAHVAGSLCGRVSSEVGSTTIGYERRYNQALAMKTQREFVEYMNQSLPARPPNMARIVEHNRGPLRAGDSKPRLVEPTTAQSLVDEGSVLLDVRPTEEYLEGHTVGALHIALDGGQFGTRAGFLIPEAAGIVILAGSVTMAESAAEALKVVAIDGAPCYALFPDWVAFGLPVAPMDSVDVAEVRAQLQCQNVQLIDVRDDSEWRNGHIKGAVHIPYHGVPKRAKELDPAVPTLTICASGGRSAVAASIFEREGFGSVSNVTGGMSAWTHAGFPVET